MNAIVVIAGSAGSLEPMRQIVAALPASCTASIFIVVHIGNNPSVLPWILKQHGRLAAEFPTDGTVIKAGHIYVAPPDRHMILDHGVVRLTQGDKVHYTRPAADPLFFSAAAAYGDQVMGIVLSGGDGDGAEGLRAIKKHGGTALVQHPDEAAQPSMPYAAMKADHPEAWLRTDEIAERVLAFCADRPNASTGYS